MTLPRTRGSAKGGLPLAEYLSLLREFDAPSWAAGRSLLAALVGRPPEDPELVRRVTGRTTLPTKPARESYWIVGRGAGKSRLASVVGTYYAAARTYRRVAGEKIYVLIIAPTKQQATITRNYCGGLLRSVPALEALISRETQTAIELTTGVVLEIVTPDFRHVRGRAIACAIIEEGAFLPTDDSATPDTELLRALGPALARVPGSLLLFVSSPYARRGELYRAWREHYGKDDSDVLVVQADTLTLNPTFDAATIDRAYHEDPASAASEYGAQFRSDIETFLTREAIDACTIEGRRELPPDPAHTCVAVLDFAGGSGSDSATLGIGHREVRGAHDVLVVDAVREFRPPFSPQAVCGETAAVMKTYRCVRALSDKYAGQFPIEEMRKYGVLVEPSAAPKSDLYRELLPLVNSRRIELLDLTRLQTQLLALERRSGRGGRDTIDHPPGGHDDVANVVALLAAATATTGLPRLPEMRSCLRIDAGLSDGGCYVLGGMGIPSDPLCLQCPAHAGVLAAWRADDQGMDLRTYRAQRFGQNRFTAAVAERRALAETAKWYDRTF